MSHTQLFWKLYLTYLVAVALCAGVVGLLAVSAADSLYHGQASSDLKARAELVRAQAAGFVDQPTKLQPLVERLGTTSDTRVTVIAGPFSPDAVIGKVLADSQADPAAMENHNTPGRPEVQAALAGGSGEDVRGSRTLHREMLYVAIPVFDGAHHVVAVVRTALPLTELNQSLDAMTRRIIVGTLLVAAAVAVLGLVVSRKFSSRMREIQRGADRFAAGDFTHEIHVSRTDEIGALAASLNRMGRQLNETIQTITGERNEREAVLAGMTEGVLAVDGQERVITVNAAAGALLGVAPREAEGRILHEVVRNPDLQAFVASALASDEPVESDVALHVGQETRDLQAHGARLPQGNGAGGGGAVIVLNDVTRLRHFEAIRRDFVANVSHEIKTPVTSIKGFAETLLDGALDDRADAERFLRIIVGQADRLGAIIGDLLSLSNLESGADGAAIPLERGSMRDVLQVAVDVCEMKAGAKDITLSLSCADDLYAEINPPLLEQAVVNLIDNAIKYSPAGSTVEVAATVEPSGLSISVQDHGPGIAREHLSRLFERFYRIDKARSRDMGGTGLGLSIVKHIAVAHGGWVSVKSTPGLGSTFTITLPV
jgi:two-component system phosphate regulon sensor histidine kinase PhoR